MRIIYFIKIAFLLFITFTKTPIIAGDTLKVLTYNINGMKPGSSPEIRINHIIENLIKINPDIISLQEINELLDGTKNQGQKIADSLSKYFNIPYYYYSAYEHLAWGNQVRELIGIISKYPIIKHNHKTLSRGIFDRQVIWCYIQTPAGMINMFTTHLSFNSDSIRIKQVQEIKNFVLEREAENTSVGTIISGDFNSNSNTKPIQMLSNDYVDSFAEVNQNSIGYTISAVSPEYRIDYIFYKYTPIITNVSSGVVMKHSYDGIHYCSDHFAVITRFLILSNK